MTPFIALAAAGLSLTAPTASPSPTASPASADRQAPRTAATRYCFKYEITGSIIPRKTCKTYDEWMKDGVDPTARP